MLCYVYVMYQNYQPYNYYIAKNWALAMMLKALPLVHFWSILLLKEQMMTSADDLVKDTGLISTKPINFKRNLP